MPTSALWKKAQYWRADEGIGPYMGFQLVREHLGSLVQRELARASYASARLRDCKTALYCESARKKESSDPLSPSVRTGAAPLDQQGEPFAPLHKGSLWRPMAAPTLFIQDFAIKTPPGHSPRGYVMD